MTSGPRKSNPTLLLSSCTVSEKVPGGFEEGA
ncbi:hypothetical protein ACVLVH_004865, partial [Kluyvera sp. 1366]